MQSFVTFWRFLSLIGTFAFPQLLGILLYLRLSRAPRWVASIAAVLAPAIFFILLAPIFLFAGVREAYARGERGCGMPAMGAILLLYAGTIIQVVAGLITQLALSARRRRKATT